MTMTTDLLRTPLHDWHVAHGGRMVDFAGWSMPVQYASIIEEHNATRNAVGVFDISHMGRLDFGGDASLTFLDSITTRRVIDIKPDQVRYSLVCNEEGGILDDVLVYGSPPPHEQPVILIVNASNRDKIIAWINAHIHFPIYRSTDYHPFASMVDRTRDTAMIAVQGPKAADVLAQSLEDERLGHLADFRELRYYRYSADYFEAQSTYLLPKPGSRTTHVMKAMVSRTGYTGEDGFEIICPAERAPKLWEGLITASKRVGGIACGLGARDTLRLEAAMPLYGHELSEAINPIQAGLNFAVNLGGREFIGNDALERFAADNSQPVRVGLHLDGKRVGRQGCPVLHEGEIVGEVTSGTFAPTLQRSIAMAYVQPSAHAVGTRLAVDIRGTHQPAIVVPLPFYKRMKNN
jgi:aminomethyltransferase